MKTWEVGNENFRKLEVIELKVGVWALHRTSTSLKISQAEEFVFPTKLKKCVT